VFPFRFYAAAKHAPQLEDEINQAFLAHLQAMPKFKGKTVVIIDVSGSMRQNMSLKSEMDRMEAACSLGAICREICEDVSVYATAGSDARRTHQTELVPNRRGIPLVSAIADMCAPLGGGGIFLKQVLDHVHSIEGDVERVIVITDEADCGVGASDSPLRARLMGKKNYVINVASYRPSITTDRWHKIEGFSEAVLQYIYEMEQQDAV
jgi:60 kDa SS-A/Ro ribonucleoprotein